MPANSGFAVHIASSYSELLGAAGRWLEGRTTEALVVAASKGAADDFLRATGKAWMGVHVFTLTQLAAALASADLGARAMTPMSHLSLEALTARVIHEERRREPLAYFDPVADTPGFVRALAATLGELRMESVDAAALAASGEPGRDARATFGWLRPRCRC